MHAHDYARLIDIERRLEESIELSTLIECRCQKTFKTGQKCVPCQLKKRMVATRRLLAMAIKDGEGS